MRFSILVLLFAGCASAPVTDDCAQRSLEAHKLADIVGKKERWFHSVYQRYTSSLESVISELEGSLRYNALFLSADPREDAGWSFYTPGGGPGAHANNLFLSLARGDNALLEGSRRKVWIDSRYRTGEFTEAELAKSCPDCVAAKDRFKAAIVAKFPDGRTDLWILTESGPLTHQIEGCGK